MKREYSYGSIILVEIIIGIVAFGFYLAFGRNLSTLYSLISSIITWLGSFIIMSALINNRKGNIRDYLNQLQRLDKKAIIVNLIIILISFSIGKVSGGKSGFLSIKDNPASIWSTALFGTIFSAIFAIFTTYVNHVVSDPRNKDQSILDAFKSVFVIGGKLFGKTIFLYFLYLILPLIVVLLTIAGIMIKTNSFGGGGLTIYAILIALLVIYCILISPVVYARLADNYLNLTGDIEEENKNLEKKDEFTITRSI